MHRRYFYAIVSAAIIRSVCCISSLCVAQEIDNSVIYVSLGLIKTSNLGAFEQYLSNNSSPSSHSSSGSSNSSGSSIANNFSPSNNPHDLKIALPAGIGAMGQIGFEQNINFGSLSSRIRYGFLAFFDFTSIAATAPTGWGIFSDSIDAVASNEIDAAGAILGLQIYESKTKNVKHQLYAEVGFLRCQTMSTVVANSSSLDVNINEYGYFNTPIMLIEYSAEPNNSKNKLGLIFDIMTLPSPYIWNVGLSLGIKKIF